MMYPTHVDFPVKWSTLSELVFRIIRCEAVSRESWTASFLDVYVLCTARPDSHAATLYSSTSTLITSRVKEIAEELESLDDSELLPAYVHHWQTFHCGLTYLDNLYGCVNQHYVKNLRPTEAEMCFSAVVPMADRHTMEILEVGLYNWKLYPIERIEKRLSNCLMREVHNDRMGIAGQQDYISPAIESFRRIGELRDFERGGMEVYNKIFQHSLLEVTREFYTNWAVKREAELVCSQYIKEALRLRDEESIRAQRYFKWSFPKVQVLFQEIIVKDRLEFLNRNVRLVVAEEHRADLRNLFQLLAPDNLCLELAHWFGQHIMLLIREAIASLPQELALAPTHFVETLLRIRNRFIQMIDDLFDGMTSFRNQMDRAFEQAVNDRGTTGATPSAPKSRNPRPSELLCRYMDAMLRKSSSTPSERQFEEKLSEAITIFKYIDDKDMFHKYYQRMLCKRLISVTTPMMELEELVINQLKVVCGHEFAGKFQRMFNDVQLSSESNRKFAAYLETKSAQFKFGYHFNVLTQCSWPISLTGVTEFKLPNELKECSSHFETFYSTSFQGRQMRWAHNYSTVELVLLFADKPYQLQAPTIQATILLLFDTMDTDSITLNDLYSNVQLTQADAVQDAKEPRAPKASKSDVMDTTTGTAVAADQVVRILMPLLEIGLLVLKSSDGALLSMEASSLSADTIIYLDRAFVHKRLKIRLSYGSQNKEAAQSEAEQIDRQVQDDRRYFIQAAIVRIMKSRKQIEHTTLVKSVLQQASDRFQPSVQLIKRCIETLIDKGYIERSPDNPDHYSYLA